MAINLLWVSNFWISPPHLDQEGCGRLVPNAPNGGQDLDILLQGGLAELDLAKKDDKKGHALLHILLIYGN